jgi:hypothetical protein
MDTGNPLAAFIEAGVWHGSLERAEAILAAHPEIAGSDIHSAAILGDDATVRRFLALDAVSATAKGGPCGWVSRNIFASIARERPASFGQRVQRGSLRRNADYAAKGTVSEWATIHLVAKVTLRRRSIA